MHEVCASTQPARAASPALPTLTRLLALSQPPEPHSQLHSTQLGDPQHLCVGFSIENMNATAKLEKSKLVPGSVIALLLLS